MMKVEENRMGDKPRRKPEPCFHDSLKSRRYLSIIPQRSVLPASLSSSEN